MVLCLGFNEKGLFAVASLLYVRNKMLCLYPGRKILECVGAAVSGFILVIKAFFFLTHFLYWLKYVQHGF